MYEVFIFIFDCGGWCAHDFVWGSGVDNGMREKRVRRSDLKKNCE